MKKLIPLMKLLELELRSGNEHYPKSIWEELSKLTDWEYRIIQDFILRVKMAISRNNMNFIYKIYEKKEVKKSEQLKSVDLTIAMIKRTENDTILTDVVNRLVIPSGITWKPLVIWGMDIVSARNFAVEKALKTGSKFLLFIDDDIIAPNNALMKLWNVMHDDYKSRPVVSAIYPKKIEPLEYPFEWKSGGTIYKKEEDEKEVVSHIEHKVSQVPIDNSVVVCNSMCGMGFALLNLGAIVEKIALPLFWSFGAPDGFWSLGEDAFFTQNLVENGLTPYVDTSIQCLHMDKAWKKVYGKKDPDVTYATNIWNTHDEFLEIRKPPKFPSILVGIPKRKPDDPIACELNKMMLQRGYKSSIFGVHSLPVDNAREEIVKRALSEGHDYVMFIDDDIIPTDDAAMKMVDYLESYPEASGVAANYRFKGEPEESAHLQIDKDGIVKAIDSKMLEEGGQTFRSNWLVALGFSIIKTSIFKDMRRPWFKCYERDPNSGGLINEDAHFTELCNINGFEIHVMPDLNCLHVDFQNQIIYGKYDQNKKYACNDALLSWKKVV